MNNNTAKSLLFLLIGLLVGGVVGYQWYIFNKPVISYHRENIKVKIDPNERLERMTNFLPCEVEHIALKENNWIEFVYNGEKYLIKNGIVIPCKR